MIKPGVLGVKMLLPEVSNWLILFVGIGGAILNIACVFVFAKQKFRKKLHKLLMILALYDLLVSESTVLKKYKCYLIKIKAIFVPYFTDCNIMRSPVPNAPLGPECRR